MRIVVIAEEKEVNPKNDFYATSFDFSSKTVTQNIIRCLKNKNYDVVHYLNPQQFLDNIKKHKNDIVFSTLWGGPHYYGVGPTLEIKEAIYLQYVKRIKSNILELIRMYKLCAKINIYLNCI